MKVFVAGATGVLGKRAVARLVQAGHEVTAIARAADKAELLRALGATPAHVSLFDRDALTAAVAGHEVVINLATRIPPTSRMVVPAAWAENDRIRTEGAANLVDAALAGGAHRYIQESITFRYRDSGDRWIDAESAERIDIAFGSSIDRAEESAARFTASGGTGIVLRFGLFYAPDAIHTEAMATAARRGVALVAGAPTAYQSSIHADDAAAAVVAALDAPAGIYDVVDDEPLTKRETARVLAGRLRVPGALTKLAGANGKLLGASQRVSNRRFKEATGWSPAYRSLREAWPAVLAELPPPERRPLPERLVRPVLLLLAVAALQVGVWITVSPRSFYDDFPTPARQWVAVDGPYNEHLLRDFGQSQLALAVVLGAAFLRPQRFLVRTAALASLVFAVPHLTYHATHLDVYGTSDKIANIVLLSLAVLGPAVLVLGTARSAPAADTAGTVGGSWAPSGSSSPPSSVRSPG